MVELLPNNDGFDAVAVVDAALFPKPGVLIEVVVVGLLNDIPLNPEGPVKLEPTVGVFDAFPNDKFDGLSKELVLLLLEKLRDGAVVVVVAFDAPKEKPPGF